MPDVSLLLPLAELLGISVTELLEGRRLEEQQLPANEVEALVKKALTIPKEPVEVRRGRVKKYLPVYLVCNVLGAVEALAVWNLGWVSEKMGTLLWVSCFFGFLFGAYYFFTEEVLPSYYDENRINYIAQGAFRMNIPGVYFNNHNWPIILRWARIWTVVTALAMPPLFAVGTWIGKRVGVELGWVIWALYLGSMVLSIIVPAKKYEFYALLAASAKIGASAKKGACGESRIFVLHAVKRPFASFYRAKGCVFYETETFCAKASHAAAVADFSADFAGAAAVLAPAGQFGRTHQP